MIGRKWWIAECEAPAFQQNRSSALFGHGGLEQLIAYVTIFGGVVAAAAPAIPCALRTRLLLLALSAWTVSAIVFVCGAVCALAANDGNASHKGARRFGLIGLPVCLFGASQLAIARWLWDDASITWNVDWRYALSQAQAIARTGDLSVTLDYVGEPLLYHVGPVWFAAAVQRVFGVGLEVVLFGLVPALCAISIISGGALLLRRFGSAQTIALVAVIAALTVPGLELTPASFLAAPGRLLRAGPPLGVGIMLNGHFGMAVAFCSLALLTEVGDRRRVGMLCGSVGLGALLVLKPQYFIGMGILAGFMSVSRAIGVVVTGRPRWHLSSFARALVLASVAVAWVLISVVITSVLEPDSRFGFWLAIAGPLVLVAVARPPVDVSGGRRKFDMFLATLLALVAGLLLMGLVPNFPSPFGLPEWAPGRTGWQSTDFLSATAFGFAISAVLVLSGVAWKESDRRIGQLYSLAWLSLTAIATIAVTLELLLFPMKLDVVAQGMAFGGWQVDEKAWQFNLAQSLIPLRTLLVATCVAIVLTCLAYLPRPIRSLVPAAFASLSLLYAASLIPRMVNPALGLEAAIDPDLRTMLESLDRESTLLISSDLADPAENYLRPGNGVLLTAYGGLQFYASEFRYVPGIRPDAPRRQREMRAFFGSPWSKWHDGWLQDAGISHVLVHDRCVPAWASELPPSLEPQSSRGAWDLYRVRRAQQREHAPPPAEIDEMEPKYGISECLLLRQRQGT